MNPINVISSATNLTRYSATSYYYAWLLGSESDSLSKEFRVPIEKVVQLNRDILQTCVENVITMFEKDVEMCHILERLEPKSER